MHFLLPRVFSSAASLASFGTVSSLTISVFPSLPSVQGRFPHSQSSSKPLWRRCALRFLHSCLRSFAGKQRQKEARNTAGAVAALLALSTSILVLLGVLAAPWLIYAIVPGFQGEKRELTILLVRILFPGAGLLVASAWCLGVLNSHRKFFISYTAPVLWNIAMIAGMIAFGRTRSQNSLVIITAWASVVGSAMQVAVQLPIVLKLLGGLKLSLAHQAEHVQTVSAISSPFSSAAASSRSALTSMRSSQAGCPPAQSRAWLTRKRSTPSRKPLRHVRLRCRIAGDERRRRRSRAKSPDILRTRLNTGFAKSPSSWFRPSSDFWSLVTSSSRPSIKPVRAFHPCRRNLCLGNSRRLHGWLARFHSWPPLLLRLLRSARHAHASAFCHRPRPAHHRSWLSAGPAPSATPRHRAALGRCRPHHFRRHRFLGRIHASPARHPPPHRARRCASPSLLRSGSPRFSPLPLPAVLALALSARADRLFLPIFVLGAYGIVFFAVSLALKLPEANPCWDDSAGALRAK